MRKRSISEVTKVTDINMNYINKFIETASNEDLDWIEKTTKKCKDDAEKDIRTAHPNLCDEEIEKRTDRQYFGAFRSAFAHEYHPELFAAKKLPAKKNSMADAITKRRAALNATI